ncbi:MAG: hypothetical protein GX180_14060 [Enterococcus sp.]|nr:hypothetical protein [Enterococcus sp.]
MEDNKKKHIKTFREFLADRKKNEPKKVEKKIDWEARKTKWLTSVDNLYATVDNIIVNNFRSAGFHVTTKKEEVRIFEEYIGAYYIKNYFITADDIEVKFFPIGTIIIGAFGRVNMILPSETIKLVLQNWSDWRIVSGFGSAIELIEFKEESIVKLFQENL